MLELFLSIAMAVAILLWTEYLSRHKKLHTETSRKIAHVVIAIMVATWPFFISMNAIAILGLVFLVAALADRKLNVLGASREVDRLSWGEFFFAIAVIAVALLEPSKWVFAAAFLQLGLADTFAAIAGKKFGKYHFRVIGGKKSVEGSLAFFAVSLLITAWVVLFAPAGLQLAWPVIVWLPILATMLEAAAPYGLDNLVVPILVAGVLSSLRTLG